MTPYVRIKDYIINLENITFIRITDSYVEFGLVDMPNRQENIKFEKGTDLSEGEFEQVREFVLELPDSDRVIVV